MRNFQSYFLSRSIKFSLLIFLSLLTLSVNAQKDILLYSTDFTTWGAISGITDSKVVAPCSGGGDGFSVGGKPEVHPSDAAPDSKVGFVYFNDGSGYIDFKPFDFVSGGAVEIEFYSNKSGKAMVVSGVSVTNSYIDERPTSSESTLSSISGNTFTSGKDYGSFKVTFEFSGSGSQTIKLADPAKTDWHITGLKVYSGVGSVPYVASTNYPKAPADGLVLSATKGGASVPGTIDVKAWNISGKVKLSVVGEGAARFSLPVTELDNATALAGTSVTVEYSPSVMAGINSAMLMIEDEAGVADPYYVSLVGTTSSTGGTEITTSTSEVMLWSYPSGAATKTITVSGVNLTGDVSISIQGTNAISFKPSVSTVSALNAQSGYDIDVSYEGANEATEETAVLVLSSPGAADVSIPLTGITDWVKQRLIPLAFSVVDENGNPGGGGYVQTDIVGPDYKKGTKVTATVTLEDGYKVVSWSDNLTLSPSVRTFTVGVTTDLENVIIKVTKGEQTGDVVVSDLYAYAPTNITETSFDISWSTIPAATGYTVTVYDESGNPYGSPYTVGSGVTSLTVSGLTAYTLYTFKVDATTSDATSPSTGYVGPYRTGGTIPFVCGQ